MTVVDSKKFTETGNQMVTYQKMYKSIDRSIYYIWFDECYDLYVYNTGVPKWISDGDAVHDGQA